MAILWGSFFRLQPINEAYVLEFHFTRFSVRTVLFLPQNPCEAGTPCNGALCLMLQLINLLIKPSFTNKQTKI